MNDWMDKWMNKWMNANKSTSFYLFRCRQFGRWPLFGSECRRRRRFSGSVSIFSLLFYSLFIRSSLFVHLLVIYIHLLIMFVCPVLPSRPVLDGLISFVSCFSRCYLLGINDVTSKNAIEYIVNEMGYNLKKKKLFASSYHKLWKPINYAPNLSVLW